MNPEPVGDILDSRYLDQFRTKPAVLRNLIEIFFEDGPSLLEKIQTSFEQREEASLKDGVHTLKGLSMNTGVSRLHTLCHHLEKAWEQGSPPERADLEALVSEFNKGRSALNPYLGELSTTPGEDRPALPAFSSTLLVVEDTRSSRLLIRMVLGDRYHLLEATNGSEALKIIEQQAPDLAIVDLNLGHGPSGTPSGLQLLKKLKNRIPTLVLTVDQRGESIDGAAGAGVWGYLLKTPGLTSLRPTVEVLLARAAEIKNRANNQVVATAIGWLMATYRINQEVAIQILNGYAARERLRPAECAKALLDVQEVFNSLSAYVNEFINHHPRQE